MIFYQYFGTPAGGWSTRYYEFARRWVKSGHEVTIVTSPYYKSDIRVDKFLTQRNIEGINLLIINTPDSNKEGVLKRGFNALIFAMISTYYGLSKNFDVVLSSSGPITVGIPALFAKSFRNKSMVFEVRDLWPRGGIELGKLKNPIIQKLALRFEKLCYRKSDLVVACSKGMEDGVLEVSPGSNTLVIPNSSDVSLFSENEPAGPNSIPDSLDEPYLIYIGSLGLMDDCSQIIYGIKAAEKLDFRMIFFGDGQERKSLQNLCSELEIQHRVQFRGLVPKTELVNWLKNARASFVTFKDYPVLHTSSPNKMFDSFAAGIPVIQSTRGWIAELIRDSGAGWNVEPGNPESFAHAISEAISDPALAKEKGQKAIHLAKTAFNRDSLSKEYISKIELLIS